MGPSAVQDEQCRVEFLAQLQKKEHMRRIEKSHQAPFFTLLILQEP